MRKALVVALPILVVTRKRGGSGASDLAHRRLRRDRMRLLAGVDVRNVDELILEPEARY